MIPGSSAHPGSLAACLLLAGCLSTRAEQPAQVVRGPLATRAQHPVALTLLSMRPRRAMVQPQSSWGVGVDLAYSSMHEVDSEPGERVHFDGETGRTAARFRRGLGGGWDVETEVSTLYTTSGFLDHFIDVFHRAFGLPDAGRSLRESDQFRMRLRHDGVLIYDLEEDRFGFGDVPLIFTRCLREEDAHGPAYALRLGVELPTGSEARGYGNGGLDYGAGLLAERSFGRWSWSAALDVVQPATPSAFESADVQLRTIYSAQTGLEYRWSDRLSLLAELALTSPMTRDFALEEFSREILDLAVGVAWDVEGATVHAAVTEDAIAATGPDFGMLFGVSWGF